MTSLEEARGLLNAKEYARAVAALDRLLLDRPDLGPAHFERGRALMGLERWAEAILACGEALKRDGAPAEAWYNLGICRGKLGEHGAAVADFSRYLENRPGDADSHLERANRLLDLGEFAGATSDYEKAAALDVGREPQIRTWIDISRQLERLRREGPPAGFASACLERGRTKIRYGDPRSAVAWFSRAVEAVPGDAEARRARAEARFALGEKTDAIADAAKASELAPDSGDVWRTFGMIRRKTGDAPGAIHCFGKALDLNADDLDSWFGRGLARSDSGDFAGAEVDFGSALERNPGLSSTWLNRGWIRGKLGRHQEAVADYTRAVELDAKSARAFANRGYARQTLMDLAGMREDFTKALELDSAFETELRPLLAAVPATGTLPPPEGGPSTGTVPPAGNLTSIGTAPTMLPPAAPVSSQAALPDEESGRMFLFGMGIAAILLALGLLKVPYLGAAPARALDIPFKSALILSGSVEGGTFSWTSSELCNEPFCAGLGTDLEVVWGRAGYSSQHRWAFCKLHKSSLWSTGSRLDGPLFLIPYWVLAYGAYLILGFALIPLAIRIVALPVLLPAVVLKRRRWRVLLPWQEADKGWGDGLDALGFLITSVVLCVSAIAYWWF